MTPSLLTSRLILRPPQLGDADALALYLNDFEVSGNLARVPYPYLRSDAVAWLGSQRPRPAAEETSFAIELAGVGYVGHIGYQKVGEVPVIGYWLGKPFWGRGIMTEAAIAAIDWFFEASDASDIYSGVFHFNQPSLAIQKRLGFTETGHSTLLCLARGVELEHIDTKLARSVWKARRQ
ncbi:Protein N-acetyltransferase, RimJ/RimL family [Devosia lucknowensis]|uniref:Protein N-acetyltransferase, RimJ/RimL family n=1 Tax=Devosia lucknowensis TaxID=1096929 RepID=A0A1Y6G9U9_9HYPH|nr:GNAT family N-acetyltransferase [Devosia lucknowensis]SMQ86163.1 Protein N-acetyltransferase, RimJ/RimL family [Devosia lucknowensis]